MSAPEIYSNELQEYLDIGLKATHGGGLKTSGDGDSSYRYTCEDIEQDKEAVSFDGVAGVFLQNHGARGRVISIEGTLRLSADGWFAVQDQRAAWRSAESTYQVVDDDGNVLDDCDLRRFDIGTRTRISGGGDIIWLAPYRLELYQLVV